METQVANCHPITTEKCPFSLNEHWCADGRKMPVFWLKCFYIIELHCYIKKAQLAVVLFFNFFICLLSPTLLTFSSVFFLIINACKDNLRNMRSESETVISATDKEADRTLSHSLASPQTLQHEDYPTWLFSSIEYESTERLLKGSILRLVQHRSKFHSFQSLYHV